MRIAYDNLIDDLTLSAFTVIGTATGYPVTNVQEQRLSVRYRTASPTAQSVIIDFATAQSITTAAILGHNISASATASSILVSARADTGFTAGNVIATLTRNEDAILKFFTAASFRYWKFSIDDQSNTDGYLEMGRLWLGTYITILPSSLLDFTVAKRRSDIVTYGKNRQKYASIGEDWRRFELNFPPTGGSALTAIQTMFDAVGLHSSLLFTHLDLDYSYPIIYPCYCSITDEISFSHDKRLNFNFSLVLEENK